MKITSKLAALAVAASAATLGTAAPGVADAKTLTEPCTKNLSTGQVSYASNFSSDNIIEKVTFKEKSRAGGTAYGTCTIVLKFQPPD